VANWTKGGCSQCIRGDGYWLNHAGNLRLSKWKYVGIHLEDKAGCEAYMTTGCVLTWKERGGCEDEKYVLMNITCNEGFLSFQNGPSLPSFVVAKAPLKALHFSEEFAQSPHEIQRNTPQERHYLQIPLIRYFTVYRYSGHVHSARTRALAAAFSFPCVLTSRLPLVCAYRPSDTLPSQIAMRNQSI
jgi:hypothetical protein